MFQILFTMLRFAPLPLSLSQLLASRFAVVLCVSLRLLSPAFLALTPGLRPLFL